MNDFTKDELKELNSCVYDHVRFKDSSMQDILLTKIKSLIDNSCFCDNPDLIYADGDNHGTCTKCRKLVRLK